MYNDGVFGLSDEHEKLIYGANDLYLLSYYLQSNLSNYRHKYQRLKTDYQNNSIRSDAFDIQMEKRSCDLNCIFQYSNNFFFHRQLQPNHGI